MFESIPDESLALEFPLLSKLEVLLQTTFWNFFGGLFLYFLLILIFVTLIIIKLIKHAFYTKFYFLYDPSFSLASTDGNTNMLFMYEISSSLDVGSSMLSLLLSEIEP